MANDSKQRWKSAGQEQILFLDIETASGAAGLGEISPTLRKLWLEKAARLNDRESSGLTDEEYYFGRAAIYAEFGRVVCVSVGVVTPGSDELHLKSYAGEDEASLLAAVSDLLAKSAAKRPFLCGHNIKEFDVPYLGRRMLINGLELPPQLDVAGLRPWDVAHIDTMELWRFGDIKSYTKLELILEVLGLESSKTDISGADVTPIFWQGGVERIARYCQNDVVAVANLLRYLRREEIIPPAKIIIKDAEIFPSRRAS